MPDYDLAVIGGGPAGYTAAIEAARRGATVALVEAERTGGACVHHACIPTNIMTNAAATFVEARELDVMGVFQAGDSFNLARAAARKDALVTKIADGIGAALRMNRVDVVEGRARFSGPTSLTVDSPEGARELSAEAFIVATGTRWEPPEIPGVPASRVLTADAVQALPSAPASALVLGGGPAGTAFALEYATLLAIAGSDVTVASPTPSIIPALDAALDPIVRASLEAFGVRVVDNVSGLQGEDGDMLTLLRPGGRESVSAEVVVSADVRTPFFASLGLEAAGVTTSDRVAVDRACRTNVPHIFAAGDVTRGPMLSSSASHMGTVAAANATGGEAVTRLAAIPHVLHTVPEVAWVGLTEEEARAQGYDVVTGAADLAFNARAIALGAREGGLKVVAEGELGEVLGVHVAGPEAAELANIAAALMQAEVPLADWGATTFWHPSAAESLAEAARRALA